MDIENLKEILRKNNVPDYYGIYINCKGYPPTALYYIFCDKVNQCVILCDYENLELLED